MWHFIAAGKLGYQRWTWRKYSDSLPTLRSRGAFQGINEVVADAKRYGFEPAADRWEMFDGQGTTGSRRPVRRAVLQPRRPNRT